MERYVAYSIFVTIVRKILKKIIDEMYLTKVKGKEKETKVI